MRHTIAHSNKEIDDAIQTIKTTEVFTSFDQFCIANNIKNEILSRSTKVSDRTIARARKGLPIRPIQRKKLLKFLPLLNPELIIEWNSSLHHLGNIQNKTIRVEVESLKSIINQLLETIKEQQKQIDQLKEDIESLM